MIAKLLTLLMGLWTAFLAIIFTALWSVPIAVAGVIKLLIPNKKIRLYITLFSDAMMWCWCCSLAFILFITNRIRWDVEGINGLSKQNWYLLISNHKSWTDIVVLCALLRNHIPMNKYFLKQQLIWVPFVGLACWALDMPFMQRYSPAYLLKHPEKRGKDLETTQKSCEKFKLHPTTVVNFAEGSRFTEEKHLAAHSGYRHLLPPKSAGIAFALSVLGKQFDQILNVTLMYPDNEKNPFLDLLCGRLKTVLVRIETIPITDKIHGDYVNDKVYKREFQHWLNELWQRKDDLLESLKKHNL